MARAMRRRRRTSDGGLEHCRFVCKTNHFQNTYINRKSIKNQMSVFINLGPPKHKSQQTAPPRPETRLGVRGQEVQFRFILPPEFVNGNYVWPQITIQSKPGTEMRGLYSKTAIKRGLLIPYVGELWGLKERDDLRGRVSELYALKAHLQTYTKSNETVSSNVIIDAEPNTPACRNNYCAASFINEATAGTTEMYNCKWVELTMQQLKNVPHYSGFFHGADAFIMVTVDIEPNSELLVHYGHNYPRHGYRSKEGNPSNWENADMFQNTIDQFSYRTVPTRDVVEDGGDTDKASMDTEWDAASGLARLRMLSQPQPPPPPPFDREITPIPDFDSPPGAEVRAAAIDVWSALEPIFKKDKNMVKPTTEAARDTLQVFEHAHSSPTNKQMSIKIKDIKKGDALLMYFETANDTFQAYNGVVYTMEPPTLYFPVDNERVKITPRLLNKTLTVNGFDQYTVRRITNLEKAEILSIAAAVAGQ